MRGGGASLSGHRVDPGQDVCQGEAGVAIQAQGAADVAVKLEDLALRGPGLLVEVVDVLRDDAVELAQLVQFGDGVVCRIRLDGVVTAIQADLENIRFPPGNSTSIESPWSTSMNVSIRSF